MPKPHIYSIPPGVPFAHHAAAWLLGRIPKNELPRTVVFVPNRRAALTLRDGFTEVSGGVPLLLPHILPLGDVDSELLLLLGAVGPKALQQLPAAMSDWQRLCLLVSQVRLFMQNRRMGAFSLEQALRLAGDLAQLQDRFTRAGIRPGMDQLEALVGADFATHWRHALEFLAIAFEHWPAIERDLGLTTKAAREVAALELLAAAWQETPPGFPVYVLGSTASQPATARLLHTIAALPDGHVVLPGLDTSYVPLTGETPEPGHPYFHLRAFLGADEAEMLGSPAAAACLWLEALAAAPHIAGWRAAKPLAKPAWEHLHLVPCAHPEEEARVIALLMREAGGDEARRTALITPDESLMQRVALHLKRWNIAVDRVAGKTLAETPCGTLLRALLDVMQAPERMLPLISLLRHPSLALAAPATWHAWLAVAEPKLRGVVTTAPGRLPTKLDNGPVTEAVSRLLRQWTETAQRPKAASEWAAACRALLRDLAKEPEGSDAIGDVLDGCAYADILGPLELEAFVALLDKQLEQPWRRPILDALPNLAMLTPVEARLQHFDRVILGNMQARLWPGLAHSGPWLNMAQQEALGLPSAKEAASLMAHDLLMLGSMGETFLTWPQREAGAPVTRSPYIERVLARLALQGVDETTLRADAYLAYARKLYAADEFLPESPPYPKPAERPTILPVSALDDLFKDPYKIYGRYVLGLKALDEIDAEPEALDFGSLTHRMLQELSAYWTANGASPGAEEMQAMVDKALSKFSGRPGIELFWRDRLRRALAFVNTQEATRRPELRAVAAEKEIDREIEVAPDLTMTLRGRIDRLETREGGDVIADYKTGRIPTDTEIREGRAVQLLAYVLLHGAEGGDTARIEYWKLPRAGSEGEIKPLDIDETVRDEMLPALRAALASWLDSATPLLARPFGGEERFENDYDGISRYDEWAG